MITHLFNAHYACFWASVILSFETPDFHIDSKYKIEVEYS